MKQSFTLSELYTHRGCYSKEMINYCARGNQVITLDFIINHNEMKLTEKSWFISNHIDMTPNEHATFAQGLADIAVCLFSVNQPLSIKQIVRAAITDDEYITKAMNIASNYDQTHAYAIYAACTRDPYDRIYSACHSAQLAGKFWIERIEDYMKQFCIS